MSAARLAKRSLSATFGFSAIVRMAVLAIASLGSAGLRKTSSCLSRSPKAPALQVSLGTSCVFWGLCTLSC